MYKMILVAVDITHGELGKLLISRAEALIGTDGRMQLVFVQEDVPAYVLSELPRDIVENRRADALTHLRALASAANVEAEVDLRSGHAATGILASAKDCNADLIMIASHRPDYRDFFIGSTAARVVRHAQCSVLISR